MNTITRNINNVPRLEEQFCFPLYACAKEVVRQYRKPLEKLGLTYTQYIVMMVLWEHGGMTEGELGKKVHLDSGTLAPLLKRLENQGLINRIRPDNNERKLFLSLTKQGEELRNKAVNVPREMDGCIPLTHEELTILKNLLDKALVSMDIKAKEKKYDL
ncbi:MAG: MarR family transcriptional regulator [Ruminococcus sp.]|nr:MarR family transcriptional regulator [Ruminococcus sp.]MBQ7504731.1 MarR family transcriptional regulator [Ruminococcus sp.]